MPDQKQFLFDWTLWFQWVLLTAVGWVLGWMLGTDVALVAAGPVIGMLQWVVLRQRIRQAGWWILATTLGWAVGWTLVIGVISPEVEVMTGTALGALTGTFQWFVLQRQLRQAGWWIVTSALGWTAGFALLTGPLLVGAVAGAVTGIALELFLRYPSLMKSQE